jgi:hypothetical protein
VDVSRPPSSTRTTHPDPRLLQDGIGDPRLLAPAHGQAKNRTTESERFFLRS